MSFQFMGREISTLRRILGCDRANDSPSSRQLELSTLEDRILLSATPVATAAPTLEVADIGHAGLPGPGAESGRIADTDLLELVAENTLPQQDVERTVTELIFVDASTDDYERLVTGIENGADTGREFDIVLLDNSRNGIAQITEVLSEYQNLDAIHLVSHGNDTGFRLGGTWVDSSVADQYNSVINGWKNALAGDADILIYGCDLAGGEAGRGLMQQISDATGADVAGSDDKTGHEELGGDWQFEYIIGAVETDVAFSEELQRSWYATLQTVNVTTTNDVLDGDTSSINNLIANMGADGAISLREALLAANSTSFSDTIVLGSGTHTLALTGTTNSTGDLDIYSDVEIVGAADGSTIIDADGIDRVFHVQSDSATLRNVTIQGGETNAAAGGGGLLVAGGSSATLDNVVLRNNAGFGGGISSAGTLTVTNSSILNNDGYAQGGGVRLNGGSSVFNVVTIAGNSGTSAGGVLVTASSLTHNFSNVTISGNSGTSAGGIGANGGYTYVTQSTITNNNATGGGGIDRSSGTVQIGNSIIAGNSSAAAGHEIDGAIVSDGFNIIGDDAGDSTGGSGYDGSDMLDQTGLHLGSLQDNGGSVRTHELQSGSVGIDPGVGSGTQLIDGRGYIRSDGNIDIGAFEQGATPNLDHELVGHFEFESASGGTVTDSSVTGNDGSFGNAPTWSPDAAVGSYALDFNGDGAFSNASAIIPDNNAYDFGTDEFSVSMWYKMTTPSETVRLVGNFSSSLQQGFAVRATAGGQFSVVRGNGVSVAYTDANAIMDGNWHQLTVTVASNGTVDVFVDGVSTTIPFGTSVVNVTTTTPIQIGAADSLTADYEGLLDDVRIYSRALSPSEATQLAAGVVQPDTTSNLEHHYRFDSDTGATLVDSSGNNRDGTWINGRQTDAQGAEGIAADVQEANGTDPESYAQVTNEYQLGADDFTIALWYKTDSAPSSNSYLLDHENQTAGGDFAGVRLYATSGESLVATFEDEGASFTSLQTTLDTTDSWTHVSLVRSGDRFELLIDGNVVDFEATSSVDSLDHPSNLYLGRSGESSSSGFEGQLDDVRIYSRALAAQDIDALVSSAATDQAPTDLVITQATDQTAGLSLNEDGGNDAYLLTTDVTFLDGHAALTYEFQFSDLAVAGTSATLYSYEGPANDGQISILADGTVDLFGYQTTGKYTELFGDGDHALAAAWDVVTGEIRVFVDGRYVESVSRPTSTTTLAPSGAVAFGQDMDAIDGNYDPTETFSGKLRDIRVFNSVRTDAAIAASHNRTLSPDEPNMLANWRFDSVGTDGRVVDYVSGNDLTVSNVGAGGGFASSEPTLTLSVDENAANGTVVGTVTGIDPEREAVLDGVGDPDDQPLTYSVESQTEVGAFTIDADTGEISVADGTKLNHEPDPTHTVTVRVTDVSGNTYDEDVFIALNDLNDSPVVVGLDLTLGSVNRNATNPVGTSVAAMLASDGGADAITDEDAGAVEGIAVVGANNTNGSWQYSQDGSTWNGLPGGLSVSNALLLDASDLIRFLPNGTFTGTESIAFRAWDQTDGRVSGATGVDTFGGGGVGSAFSTGVDIATIDVVASAAPVLSTSSAFPVRFTEGTAPVGADVEIVVTDVDSPILASARVSITVNYTQGEDFLYFTNQNNISGSWDPMNGILTLIGNASVANYQAALRSVQFENTSNDPITANRTVTWEINDGGNNSNTLVRDIQVTAVNDAPVLDNAGAMTLTAVSEDSAGNTGNTLADLIASAGGDRITDVDGPAEGIAVYNTDSTNGSWEYSLDGTTWLELDSASSSAARLLDTTSLIRFEPNADYTGTATISFKAWDQSSGKAGDTIVMATAGSALSTGLETASVTVRSVNDAPDGTDNLITLIEDGLHTFGTGTFGLIDVENDDFKSVVITTTPTVGTLTLGGANVSPGQEITLADLPSLLYSAAPNVNGTGIDGFTFQVRDDGGTTNGGVDLDPTANNISINISAVNDAPVLDTSGSLTMTTITEDDLTNDGDSILGIILSGGNVITDVDIDPEGLAIVGRNHGNGEWEYSTDNGASWTLVSAVSDNSALLLRSIDRVRFVPNGENGSAPYLDVRAWDLTSGTAGTRADVSANGGTTSFSTKVERVTLTVTAINDAPVVGANAGTSTTIGGVVGITTAMLNESDVDDDGIGLTYAVNGTTNGHVALVGSPATPVSSFTQADIDNANVVFVHDGLSGAGGSFDFTLADGGEDGVGTEPGTFVVLIGGAASDSYTTDEDKGINVDAASGLLSNDGSGTAGQLAGNVVVGFDASQDVGDDSQWNSNTGSVNLDAGSGVSLTNSPTNPPGGITNALSLTGTGALTSAALDSFPEIDTEQSATLETWIRLDSLSGPQVILDTGDSVNGGLSLVLETSGWLRLHVEDGGAFTTKAFQGPVLASTWHHIAVTIDMDAATPEVQVWIDGSQYHSRSLDALSNWGDGAFGLGTNNGTSPGGYSGSVSGEIAHFRIHDEVLSSADINANYAQPGGGAPSQPFVASFDDTATLGNVSVSADGSFTYDPNGQFEHLAPDESATDTFDYTYDDGSGNQETVTVTITIDGAEDSSVTGGVNTGTVSEDGPLTANGTLTITDVDTSDNPVSWNDLASTAGDNGFGNFAMSGNTWSYTLNNANPTVQALDVGESLTDTYTFASTDGTTQQVTVTINGAEDASVTGGITTGIVAEDETLTSSGTLTITDVDTSDNPVSWNDVASTSGGNGFGDFEITGNTWTYTLDNANPTVAALNAGESLTDTFTFVATDSSTQAVSVEINGTNDDPVITIVGSSGGTAGEGSAAAAFFNDSLTDIDSTNFDGGTLTVTVTSTPDPTGYTLGIANGPDVAVSGQAISVGSTLVGNAGGTQGTTGPLVITFNANATAADVEAVYRQFAITNTSQDPVTGPRTLEAVITDGDGGTSNVSTKSVNFTATNDIPTFSNGGPTFFYTENSPGAFIHPKLVVADADSSDFDGGDLVIQMVGGALSNDWLRIIPDGNVTVEGTNVLVAGTTIGTYSGGHGSDLVISFNRNANATNVSELARQIAFASTSDNPATGVRSIFFMLRDGDGGSNALIANNFGTNTAEDNPIARDDAGSLDFDGIDDVVVIADDPRLQVTNTVTMEAWFRADSFSAINNYSLLINKEGEYEVGLSETGEIAWAFANSDPGWSWHHTGFTVNSNKWNHVAVSYDNGTVSTFVNGTLVDVYFGSGSIGDAHPTLNELRIGGRQNNPTNKFFDGQIDEVRIWNTARTQAEIQANIDASLSGPETGLVGSWTFSDRLGNSASDFTQAGNDGLLTDGGSGTFGPQWVEYSVAANSTLSVPAPGIYFNDIDPDGHKALLISVDNTGVQGRFSVNADGSFAYDPNGAFDGLLAGQVAYDTVTYTIRDPDLNTDTATLSVRVVGVNDTPVIDLNGAGVGSGNALTFAENDAATFVAPNAIVDDFGEGDIESVGLDAVGFAVTGASEVILFNGETITGGTSELGTVVVGSTTFAYSYDGGDAFIFTRAGGGTTSTADTQSLIRAIQYQNLSNDPTAGSIDFQFTVRDTDSVDSPVASSVVTVDPVNDAPVLTVNGMTVNENSLDNPITAAMFNGVDADDSAAEITFEITSIATHGRLVFNDGSGTALMGIGSTFTQADVDAGFVFYSHDGSDTGRDSFNISLTDGGEDGAGPQTGTFDITVSNVNDAPVLDNSGTMTLTTITEDDTDTSGNLVADIIASAGGDRITDSDAGAIEGIAITSRSNAGGDWEYSLNGGTTWTAVGSVQDDQALLLRATDRIRFVPSTDTPLTAILRVRAWDQTVGTPGTKVDTAINGGTTAFSIEKASMTLAVTNINDAPVLSNNFSPVTASEDNGALLFENETVTDADNADFEGGRLAVDVIAGPDNNHSFYLTNRGGVSVSGTDIRVGGIVVGTNSSAENLQPPGTAGPLLIDFNANATANDVQAIFRAISIYNNSEIGGIRTVEAVLTDGDGGTSNTVYDDVVFTEINDAPTITPIGDQTIDEDNSTSQLTFSIDDADNTLTIANISTGSSDQSLVADDGIQVVGVAGNSYTVQVTPVANAYGGPVTVTMTVGDGTVETVGQFTVTVVSVNDAPTAVADSYSVVSAIRIDAVDGVLMNDSDIDSSQMSVNLLNGPAEGTLVLNLDGSFDYTPEATSKGLHSFTYQVTDEGGLFDTATVKLDVSTLTASVPPPTSPETDDTSDSDGETAEEQPESTDQEPVDDVTLVAEPGPETSDRQESSSSSSRVNVTAPNELKLLTLDELEAGDLMDVIDVGEHRSRGIISRFESTLRGDQQEIDRGGRRMGPSLTDSTVGVGNRYASDLARRNRFDQIVAGTVAAATTGLTVGYIVWMIRGGQLIASLVTAIPAWSVFDPMPVLDSFVVGGKEDDEESIERIVEAQ